MGYYAEQEKSVHEGDPKRELLAFR